MRHWIYTEGLGLCAGPPSFNTYTNPDEAIAAWYADKLKSLQEKKQRAELKLSTINKDIKKYNSIYNEYTLMFPEKFL